MSHTCVQPSSMICAACMDTWADEDAPTVDVADLKALDDIPWPPLEVS